jgi:hypothetical protein
MNRCLFQQLKRIERRRQALSQHLTSSVIKVSLFSFFGLISAAVMKSIFAVIVAASLLGPVQKSEAEPNSNTVQAISVRVEAARPPRSYWTAALFSSLNKSDRRAIDQISLVPPGQANFPVKRVAELTLTAWSARNWQVNMARQRRRCGWSDGYEQGASAPQSVGPIRNGMTA